MIRLILYPCTQLKCIPLRFWWFLGKIKSSAAETPGSKPWHFYILLSYLFLISVLLNHQKWQVNSPFFPKKKKWKCICEVCLVWVIGVTQWQHWCSCQRIGTSSRSQTAGIWWLYPASTFSESLSNPTLSLDTGSINKKGNYVDSPASKKDVFCHISKYIFF